MKHSCRFTFAYTRSNALFFLLEKHHFPFFLISPFDVYLALPVWIQIFFCFKTTERLYKHDEALNVTLPWKHLGKQWEEGKEAVVLYVSKVMESEHR